MTCGAQPKVACDGSVRFRSEDFFVVRDTAAQYALPAGVAVGIDEIQQTAAAVSYSFILLQEQGPPSPVVKARVPGGADPAGRPRQFYAVDHRSTN